MCNVLFFDLDGTLWDGQRLFPGVKYMLDRLKSSCRMFIISKNNNAANVCNKLGISEYFEDIYGRDRLCGSKKIIIKLLMQQLKPDYALFCDDQLSELLQCADIPGLSFSVALGYLL